jgi:CPA2 family monovalent cation:H+ antiporter-2
VAEIRPLSPAAGKTLSELALRENFGINIALINRGGQKVYAPDKNERLFPGDVITGIGTDEQLEKLNQFLEPSAADADPQPQDTDPIALKHFLVDKYSHLSDKTIRELGIRERTSGIVLGVERKGRRILNPESNMQLEEGDIVWIAGSGKKINAFIKEQQGAN